MMCYTANSQEDIVLDELPVKKIYEDSVPENNPEDDQPYSIGDNLDDISTVCVCEKAVIIFDTSSQQFPKDQITRLVEKLEQYIEHNMLNTSLVNTQQSIFPNNDEYCEELGYTMESYAGMLVVNINPRSDQTCGISKKTVLQTPLVEFNAFSLNDSKRWVMTVQSKSAYLRYQINDTSNENEMQAAGFLIKSACSPTIGRSNLHEEYSRLKWSEVENRFHASIPMYGVLLTVAFVMCIGGLWALIVVIYRRLQHAELKEQRAIRLFISEIVKKEHEREEEEEQAKLSELLKDYSSQTKKY
ncbi:unnamed protein product [Bursaphelenchus okinawaensis]|uniref:Uncharacterized protein n=1 Tax=Bursaphelenchus okinawaensis TaxID=465554 RepID=A0A811LEF3_9BILA|nr:unnamed protein product [Bursaphelenchus okinawaensis]CAG9122321.1 unnamed protein product [Bursaphelenchus okinawaensis]